MTQGGAKKLQGGQHLHSRMRPWSWDQAIAAVAQQIHQSRDLPTLWQTILESMRWLLDCDRTLVYQLSPDMAGRVVAEAVRDPQWSILDQVVQDTCFEADWLKGYTDQRVWAVSDVAQAQLTPCHAEFLAEFQVKANLAIPVRCESRLWGLLIAHHCTTPRPWPQEDVAGLQQMALYGGIAVQQASLAAQLYEAKAQLAIQAQAEQGPNRDERLRLAAIVDSSQEAILSKTLAGIITSWNPAAERLYGYTAQEIIGQSVNRLIPVDRRPEEAQITQALAQGQRIEPYETQRQHRDGRILDVSMTLSPIFDGEGRVIGTSTIARDITDSRQIELDLKAAKEQIDLVLQASSEGFSDWDLVTNKIYFSPQFKAMLGYADHEFENSLEMWNSVILPEDGEASWQLLEDYNNGKVDQFSITQRYRHKNGSIIHILTRAIHLKNAQGQMIRIVGSYLDITSLVTTQEALKKSEIQLASVLNSSLDGIMAFRSVRDWQGRIVDFAWLLSNPAACNMVGRSGDYLIGKRLLEEMPGNREEGLFDGYVRTVETGEPYQREFYYNYDGVESWFEAVAVKLEDGFSVTFRNVTALKQSEQVLCQLNAELENRVADLAQRHAEMVTLNEIGDFLQAAATVEEACGTIANLVEDLFPHCAGGIFITRESNNRLENISRFGPSLPSQAAFDPHHCWGLRRGQIHHVEADRASLRCQHIPADAALGATLCLPMMAQGETLGLLYIAAETAAALDESKQQLARTLAEQVGMAIANLKLKETLKHQSIRDPLTGLYNRRYLEEALTQEMAQAERNSHSIGVIMLDIDHFKRLNDTFGHDIGDFVLQWVAKLLRENVRKSDIVCRYGGEEMTVILPEATLAETVARAEHLRHVLSQLNPHHRGQSLGMLTASFGVAAFPIHGNTPATLIKAADTALYQAKDAGRNQVLAAQGIT